MVSSGAPVETARELRGPKELLGSPKRPPWWRWLRGVS
jgi:hypothetical protein